MTTADQIAKAASISIHAKEEHSTFVSNIMQELQIEESLALSEAYDLAEIEALADSDFTPSNWRFYS